MTETLTIYRTYYYDLGEHGIEPDYESIFALILMIIFILLLIAKTCLGKTFQNYLTCIAKMGIMV
jgi:hypothetical protein